MPYLKNNEANIYYEETGKGAQTIVFAHGLLMSCRMFDEQIASLCQKYRCIAFDFRGQGKSAVTKSGYDMDTLYKDTAFLIESLNAKPCHFVGLSMGGFIGMRLAIYRPDLLKSLTLLDTSADPEEPKNVPKYRALQFLAKLFGLRLVISQVMPIMFSPDFRTNPEKKDLCALWKKRIIANNKKGIMKAISGVIERKGVYKQLEQIKTSTLIMVGEDDIATTPEKAKRIQGKITGSKLVTISKAGHSSTVENPLEVNVALKEFLQD